MIASLSSSLLQKGSEPPQIEHVVSEQPQMVQMAPPPNMTDNLAPEELQTKVTELLVRWLLLLDVSKKIFHYELF